MSRLLAVELRRIASRRLVRLLVLGVFLVLTITNVVQAFHHTNDPSTVRSQIVADMRQYSVVGPDGKMDYGPKCDNNDFSGVQQDQATGRMIYPPQCHAMTFDESVNLQMESRDPRFLMVRDGPNMILTGLVIAALLAFLLSASVIGAEWHSGMFASLLTWEPRRMRVLLAKTLACVVFFTVVGALIIGYQLLSAAALAQTRGSFFGMTGPVTRGMAATIGRGIGLVAFTAAGGAALAGIARSTAGAMAILGGYLVVVELGARNMLNGDERWLLSRNTMALVKGETTFFLPGRQITNEAGSFYQGVRFQISAGRAAIVIAAIIAVVTLVHAALLKRRDAN
jgi:hypothetical protein